MVYVGAAKKTLGLMALSMVLGLAVVLLLAGNDSSTGLVTGTSQGTTLTINVMLGIFIGILIVGAYFYLAHYEAKRER